MNRASGKYKKTGIHQQGMGLISAIFVITLMAVIATGISRIVINNQQSNSQQILNIRAQLSAETALQKNLAELASGTLCEQSKSEQVLAKIPFCRIHSECKLTHINEVEQAEVISQSICGSGQDIASHHIKKRVLLKNPK